MGTGVTDRSRNGSRSRGQQQGTMSIVIVGSQTSGRRTFLLGSLDHREPTAQAQVRIVHID